MSDGWVTRLDGPAVETEIARDLIRRAMYVAPGLLLAGAIGWGVAGAVSVAFAIALVLANFVVAATSLAWSARISLGLMMGVAMSGFFVRLALITGTVFLFKDHAWVEIVPLGLTLIVTHLGLLAWETRYVSASLAFPGLKPERTRAQ